MWTTYMCGWLIASVAAFVVADTFPQERTPPPRACGVFAVLVGVVWPVLLIGVVQAVCIAGVAGWFRSEECARR